MRTILTEVEIANSPSRVREIFLDFTQYPVIAPELKIKSIGPVEAKDKIEAGDKIKVDLGTISFHLTVLENTAEKVKWRAVMPFLFQGDHSFLFRSSKKTPGGTTLVHEEEMSGLLSYLMKNPSGPGFAIFNEGLKGRAEGRV